MPRIAVIGGGVSGLAAAAELTHLAAAAKVQLSLVVLEASNHLGGEVLTGDFSQTSVDLGAESLLLRGDLLMPLLERLGLTDQLVRPGTTAAALWRAGRMIPIPKNSVLGVPLYPWRRDVIRAVGLGSALRATIEPILAHGRPNRDDSVAAFLAPRVGRGILNRIVDPLLGGIYAGPADQLSLGAVAPQLLAAVSSQPSLLRGLRAAAAPQATARPRSPFASFRGGLSRLTEALAASLPQDSIRTGQSVVKIESPGTQLVLQGGARITVDGALMALPAPQLAELVADSSPSLARSLRTLQYSSVATVTLAYPETALSRPLVGSGFLVTRAPRRMVTACTYLDRKWPHLHQDGLALMRASVGSFNDEWALELDDATLVASVHRDLKRMIGVAASPAAAHVERWRQALPQYREGHLSWVDSVEQEVRSMGHLIEVTGSSFRGVGVSSCIQDGQRAAAALWGQVLSASPGPAPIAPA